MKDKRILIIGGSGALGKKLIERHTISNDILVYSRDEHKHFALSKIYPDVSFKIGDVKDVQSLIDTIQDYRPDIIINCAAIKHVPICETNPYESINVNIIGHNNLIHAVRTSRHRVAVLMFISTDKACRPINIYGMCKAISERLYIDFAQKTTDTKVCLVRYGNVLESTGSVIPYFKKLLDDGATSLPITDKAMTRFFLTLDQAVDLIQRAHDDPNSHGTIAIPKVRSFYIEAIARALMEGRSMIPKTHEIGIRFGEKLHEEMISDIEMLRCVELENGYLITNSIISKNMHSYNSLDSVSFDEDALPFLKKSQII